MKIVSINTFNIGSTGKIMLQIANEARRNGMKYYVCVPKARDNYKVIDENQIFIGNRILRNLHLLLSQITGMEGFYSYISTYRFINRLDSIKPDIIHLHNVHGSYINIRLLFSYIKKRKIKTIWTLHDCWPFTGRCPYFLETNCDRWKSQCKKCIYPKSAYPKSIIDSSKFCYKTKKKLFSGVENMTIVTPSEWLADIVKQSFLKNYPVVVINNGIDLNIFRPIQSEVKTKYVSNEQYMVLGVAFNWDHRKGIDIFIELSKRLGKKYRIVLVGTYDEKNISIPNNIIMVGRTGSQNQLAELYGAADVFVNPTREDNFPTVNIESLACGTPVVTFRTGGSTEIISRESGISVEQGDIEGIEIAIKEICENKTISSVNCVRRAQSFDRMKKFKEYVDLYQSI